MKNRTEIKENDVLKPEQKENTKEKILNAARDEFIEKGYEKAKMEDIAKKAGLTKVMLYYHFNSKENILKEIIIKTIESAKIGFNEEFRSIVDVENFVFSSIKSKMEKVLKPNIEIIKLIIVESIKGNLDQVSILEPMKVFFDNNIIYLFEKAGFKVKSREDLYVNIFFFQTVPLLFNLIFSEKFNHDFNVLPEKTDRVFSEKFIDCIISTIKKSSAGNFKFLGKKKKK